jgi:hypothetical protein
MTDHRDMYGDIFITGSSLIKEIVGFCGPEAIAQFNAGLEDGSIVREGAFPPPIVGELCCLKFVSFAAGSLLLFTIRQFRRRQPPGLLDMYVLDIYVRSAELLGPILPMYDGPKHTRVKEVVLDALVRA